MVNTFRWIIFVIGLAVVIGSIMIASAEDPVISIDKPSDGETVKTKTITVSGTAEAMEGYIDSVTVNDIPAGIDTWSADIQLEDGPNPITVVATTDMGEKCSKTITVYYQAPITPPTQLPRYDGAPSATPTPTPAPTVSISITTIPSGAKVRLDNFFKGITPTLVNVTVGSHKIEVTKEGYLSHSETKKIRLGDGEPKEMIIELKPLTVSIFVYSIPSGASVYLDNVYKKDTNCTLGEVAEGPHSIKLTKSGYFDETTNEYVSADEPTSLHVTLRRCGYINISSNPPGANVYLDGNDTGETTPANISKVPQGNHTIKLTKLHYGDVNRTVSVNFSRTPPVDVNLTGYGSLTISSDPSEATVYLDGIHKGGTTEDISNVVEGSHSIRLTKSGYKNETRNILVYAEKTTDVHVDLSLTFWESLKSWIPAYVAIVAVIGLLFKYVIHPLVRPKLNGKEKSLLFIRSKLNEKEKNLLFSLDPSYRQHLKEGDVDEKLKKVFADKKQSLSPGAKVSKIDEEHWEIIGGNIQYRIEDTGLNIYKK